MPRKTRTKIYKEILNRGKLGSKSFMKLPKTPGGKKGRRRGSSY